MYKKFALKLLQKIGQNIASPQVPNDETQLLALGRMLSRQNWQLDSSNFNDYEFKVFSQFGDDGLIQFLVRNLNIQNNTFIEFGVGDYMESNTRFLLMNNNWEGFVMDGSSDNMNHLKTRSWYWRYNIACKDTFITKSNINSLLEATGLENVGLLHIDLDGNDYFILKELNMKRYNPSILILEYNSLFGVDRSISTPYKEDFFRTNAHHSNLYYGASLPALDMLSRELGYRFVGCNEAGNNAYFVRQDLLNDSVKEVSLNEGYRISQFRESRNAEGKNTFVSGKERIDIIKGLEVLNVETNTIEEL